MARPADRRPLTRTSARRPCRCPCPRPIPSHSIVPHRPGPGPRPAGQSPSCSTSTTSAAWRSRARARQVPGRRLAGPAGRAHQDDVDAGQQVPRRLGPPATRVRHEDHPAQVDAEFGCRHHPGVGQADRGAPAPGLRRRGQQGQGQRGRPMAGQPRHRGRGPSPQRPVGEEGDQGRRHRQEPTGHRRGGSDPVGQPDRELPGRGKGLLRSERTYVRTLQRRPSASSSRPDQGRHRPPSRAAGRRWPPWWGSRPYAPTGRAGPRSAQSWR